MSEEYPREVTDPITGEIMLDLGPAQQLAGNSGGMDLGDYTTVTGSTSYNVTVPASAYVYINVGATGVFWVAFVRASDSALMYLRGNSASDPYSWEGRVNGANAVRIGGVAVGTAVTYCISALARVSGQQDDFTPSAVVQDDLGFVGLDDRVRQEVARRMAVLGFTAEDKDAVLDDATWKEDVDQAEANMAAEADEEFGPSPYEEDLQGFVRVEREAAAERRERELEDEKRLEELIRARRERERDEAAQLDIERDYLNRNSSAAIAARSATPPPSSPRGPERSDPRSGKGGKASSSGTEETPPKDRPS